MSMFKFWGSDSRGGGQNLKLEYPMLHDFSIASYPIAPTISTSQVGSCAARPQLKRARDDPFSETPRAIAPAPKRVKQTVDDVPEMKPQPVAAAPAPAPVPAPAPAPAPAPTTTSTTADDVGASHSSDDRLDRARDAIQFHFGLEILYKHDELRLIDQELAKAQIALEQLRRCHLIPYPINCPTPDQMVEISSGKGPALRKPGKEVPRWAAPFGVVDGPYARHYAKWLIPDPMFDGMLPPWQSPYDPRNLKTVPEGRTTRNSVGDASLATKQRPVRGNAGQKPPSLMHGYPAAKDKNGPCVLKRQFDGQTVKLVCLDCHRDNFLSIQGFINHCRIAHRRDFKSHEEAAIHCGHPIDSNPAKSPVAPTPTVAEKKQPASATTPAPAPSSGLVHQYAQPEVSKQDALSMLQSRIQESLRLFEQGKLPGVTHIPGAPKEKKTSSGSSLVSSSDTPHLSRFMQAKKFSGNLQSLVDDAKTVVDLDNASGSDDEMAEAETPREEAPTGLRMPTQAAMTPLQHVSSTRPASMNKPHTPKHVFAEPPSVKHGGGDVVYIRDDDMEPDLSPNPSASNNAPSLVSDDGEYSESEDGSSDSEASDTLDAESISDVGDLAMDEDGDGPQSLRHHSESGGPTAVRLRKENKEVTLVGPVKNSNQRRKPRKP